MSRQGDNRTFSSKPTVSGDVKPRGTGYVAVATITSSDVKRHSSSSSSNSSSKASSLNGGELRAAISRNVYTSALGGTTARTKLNRSTTNEKKESSRSFGSVFGSKKDKKDITLRSSSSSGSSSNNNNRGVMNSTGVKRKLTKPSAKFDQHKTSDAFGSSNKGKTGFSLAYNNGGIPCRINHGGAGVNRIQWDHDPMTLNYYPLLVHCCEGLAETKHPYVFVARAAFRELLQSPMGSEKAMPLTSMLIKPLRMALLSKDEGTFPAVLDAIQQLSNAVGSELTPHISALLIQINKKVFNRKYSSKIQDTLLSLDSNGGPEAAALIKSKVPTYLA